jgi:hypothetical protein
VPSFWILIIAIAATAVTLPLAAVIVVSLASVREEWAHSLSGQAPGPLARAARRLLAYQTESADRGADWPTRQWPPTGSASERTVRHGAGGPSDEVRFGYARRPLPASRKRPAVSQPRPRPVLVDQRQGAGV